MIILLKEGLPLNTSTSPGYIVAADGKSLGFLNTSSPMVLNPYKRLSHLIRKIVYSPLVLPISTAPRVGTGLFTASNNSSMNLQLHTQRSPSIAMQYDPLFPQGFSRFDLKLRGSGNGLLHCIIAALCPETIRLISSNKRCNARASREAFSFASDRGSWLYIN